MSVYFIAIVHEVHDAEQQGEYGKRAVPHLMTTDGSLLAAAMDTEGESGRVYELNPGFKEQGILEFETLEGDKADGISVIEFPDREAFEAWYHSSTYQEALKIRQQAANCQAFLVEGYE